MSNDLVRTAEEVRDQRCQVEADIAGCQSVIDRFVAWRNTTSTEFHALAQVAMQAVENRDALLLRIEQEALWAYDYESATDYYDSKGFSRQRMHQIKIEVTWKQLVGDFDELLPLPAGHLSRHLGTTSPKIALPAYKQAVQEAGGKAPTESRVKEWLAAAKEGINVQSGCAMQQWRDRKHLIEIERHLKALKTTEAREEARKLLRTFLG